MAINLFRRDVRRDVADRDALAVAMRIRECPKCGEDISDSYIGYDPSVGIMSAGWFCDACDEFVEDDDDGSQFD